MELNSNANINAPATTAGLQPNAREIRAKKGRVLFITYVKLRIDSSKGEGRIEAICIMEVLAPKGGILEVIKISWYEKREAKMKNKCTNDFFLQRLQPRQRSPLELPELWRYRSFFLKLTPGKTQKREDWLRRVLGKRKKHRSSNFRNDILADTNSKG